MIVILPWPNVKLTPNAKRRKHWRTYCGAIQSDRRTGYLMTAAALSLDARQRLAEGEGHIPVEIRFSPPDRRRRDDDGMIGAFKHMRDGIADALGVDDHRFKCSYVIGDHAKPGKVEVRIGG